MTRTEALEEFYALLDQLRDRLGGHRTLNGSSGRSGWPQQGVYFFFENEQKRENGVDLRVVRVGTHAVARGSMTTLWSRLRQHRGNVRGAHAGGGNHRGSVFRFHVGTALLARGHYSEEIQQTWGVGGSASRTTRNREVPLERDVSTHIRNMPFLWVGVPGEAGTASDRAAIEAGAISLLSNLYRASVDAPSSAWLGHHAARASIRQSGLWNVDHADAPWDASFLPLLRSSIERM